VKLGGRKLARARMALEPLVQRLTRMRGKSICCGSYETISVPTIREDRRQFRPRYRENMSLGVADPIWEGRPVKSLSELRPILGGKLNASVRRDDGHGVYFGGECP
jgi:hypothetical protein